MSIAHHAATNVEHDIELICMERTCLLCSRSFQGMSITKYCSVECKQYAHRLVCRSYYHLRGGRDRKTLYKTTPSGKAARKRYYDKKNASPVRKLYMKSWRDEHKPYINLKMRERRQNPEVKKGETEYQRKRFSVESNREARRRKYVSDEGRRQKRAWMLKYLRSDKGKVWAANTAHRRRDRILRNGGSITLDEWNAIKLSHSNKCAYCGTDTQLTMDHIIPLARGGWHRADNIQPLCRSCNSHKGCRI